MPGKVETSTPLGVKNGHCNGTPKKGGLKVVIFLANFTLLLELKTVETDQITNEEQLNFLANTT